MGLRGQGPRATLEVRRGLRTPASDYSRWRSHGRDALDGVVCCLGRIGQRLRFSGPCVIHRGAVGVVIAAGRRRIATKTSKNAETAGEDLAVRDRLNGEPDAVVFVDDAACHGWPFMGGVDLSAHPALARDGGLYAQRRCPELDDLLAPWVERCTRLGRAYGLRMRTGSAHPSVDRAHPGAHERVLLEPRISDGFRASKSLDTKHRQRCYGLV